MSFDEFVTAKEVEQESNNIPVKSEIIEDIDQKSNSEIIVQKDSQDNISIMPEYEILNDEIPIVQKMDTILSVANTLKTIIDKQGFIAYGLNKKDPKKPYVLTPAWLLLGNIMGIVPETTVYEDITDDKGRIIGFKARAKLWRNPIIENGVIVDGEIVSQADASCTKDGNQKDISSMFSMAETRALNKAYRQRLGWIMEMAGYEGTPAEEMPNFNPNNIKKEL